MTALDQLGLLAPDGTVPPSWPCTTCDATGACLRLLYPDEREPGGRFVRLDRCPSCRGEKRLPYDPDERSVIPF